MTTFTAHLWVACAVALGAAPALAAEWIVGPNQNFARIEEALVQAQPGDVIVVQPRPGNQAYEKVVLSVEKPRLTIRAAATPGGRVRLSGRDFNYSGRGSVPRAIVQFNAKAGGCMLDGFEIMGAHNESHNGAGVRINQANDVTIRNCEIHDNDMGVMSNGDGRLASALNQRIEKCVIHHNGDATEPGFNHNLYLGGTSVALIGCEVYASVTGHNVKSRAHQIEIRDCFIHEAANRECDFVDASETGFPGSDAVLAGNRITKSADCAGNRAVIHFGQDGGKPREGTLRMENNVIRTPFVAPVIQLSAPLAHAVLQHNRFENSGKQKSGQTLFDAGAATARDQVQGSDNAFSPSFAGAGLDALKLDHTTFLNSAVP